MNPSGGGRKWVQCSICPYSGAIDTKKGRRIGPEERSGGIYVPSSA